MVSGDLYMYCDIIIMFLSSGDYMDDMLSR